ncbi:MAG: NADH-quinone oxidoreductase subunit J [Deltaproteobacteria bacterium]|nr:NADH-quinone oxidoreductase subunit J [Deltaproteobacteria bacterium]
MTAEVVVFWVLAVATVAGALCVVLPPMGRNPLHAAIALLATFFFLSGLFVLLSAHLVAVLQVLVYAGAVMVLFTFVVMLLNLRRHELAGPRPTLFKALGAAAVLAVTTKVAMVVAAALADAPAAADLPDGFGGGRDVAGNLLIDYLVPFELTSILLLVAIVGALAIARRTPGGEPDRAPGGDA